MGPEKGNPDGDFHSRDPKASKIAPFSQKGHFSKARKGEIEARIETGDWRILRRAEALAKANLPFYWVLDFEKKLKTP